MNEFLAMGGYGSYVWTAFGVTLVILIANIVIARQQFHATRAELVRRWANQQENSG